VIRPLNPENSSHAESTPNPPAFNVPSVVLAVLGFLVLIHVLIDLGGESARAWSMYALAFDPARFIEEAAIPQPTGAKWWTFLTSGFIHADWLHLGFNALWLLIFGTPVARVLGGWRFLLLTAVSIIAGSAAILLAHWGEMIILLGASGGVAGLTAAAIPIMFGLGSGRTRQVFHALPFTGYIRHRRALIVTAVMMALQVIPAWLSNESGLVTNTALIQENVIAWEAHIGGFIAGLVLFFILRRQMLSAQDKS
jgi:membrane associated rhomboid family serine protease